MPKNISNQVEGGSQVEYNPIKQVELEIQGLKENVLGYVKNIEVVRTLLRKLKSSLHRALHDSASLSVKDDIRIDFLADGRIRFYSYIYGSKDAIYISYHMSMEDFIKEVKHSMLESNINIQLLTNAVFTFMEDCVSNEEDPTNVLKVANNIFSIDEYTERLKELKGEFSEQEDDIELEMQLGEDSISEGRLYRSYMAEKSEIIKRFKDKYKDSPLLAFECICDLFYKVDRLFSKSITANYRYEGISFGDFSVIYHYKSLVSGSARTFEVNYFNVVTEKDLTDRLRKLEKDGVFTADIVAAAKILASKDVMYAVQHISEQGLLLVEAVDKVDRLKYDRREYFKLQDEYLRLAKSKESNSSVKPPTETRANDLVDCIVEIGIDCEPCSPRPDTYLQGALKVIEADTEENLNCQPVSKLFGAWTWRYDMQLPLSKVETYKLALKKHFEDLYDKGYIRGAMHSIMVQDGEDVLSFE